MDATGTTLSRNKQHKKKINFWPYIFLSPFVILYLTFSLFPLLFSFYISLTNWDGIGERTFIGLRNYYNIFLNDQLFRQSIMNTVLIMIQSIPFAIFFGLVIAVILFNLSKSRQFFQTVNFLPYITTPVAIGLIFAFLFDWTSGSVNTILVNLGIIESEINWLGQPHHARFVVSLMIVWRLTGYHIAVYLAGLSALPYELYEAAKVDGSSAINTFFKITWPLLRPITMFLVLTAIIGGLQLFDEPNLLFSGVGGIVGGPGRSALTVVWYFYDISFRTTTRMGYGAAVAYSLFIIIILATLVGRKFFKGRNDND